MGDRRWLSLGALLFALHAACGDQGSDDANTTATTDAGNTQPDARDVTLDATMEQDAPPDAPAVPSFAFLQETIFTARCGERNCHGDAGATGTPDLRLEVAYDAIVAQPSRRLPAMNYIEPGDPERSFIFHKLAGTEGEACQALDQAPNGCGGPMPPNFAQQPGPLADTDIEALRRWIVAGAPRN